MKTCQLSSTYHHWNIECGDYIIFWSNWSISLKEIKLLSFIRNTAIIMECYIHFLPMFSEKKKANCQYLLHSCTVPQYIHPIHNQSKVFSKRQIKAETSTCSSISKTILSLLKVMFYKVEVQLAQPLEVNLTYSSRAPLPGRLVYPLPGTPPCWWHWRSTPAGEARWGGSSTLCTCHCHCGWQVPEEKLST